jgi:hypothetical protein
MQDRRVLAHQAQQLQRLRPVRYRGFHGGTHGRAIMFQAATYVFRSAPSEIGCIFQRFSAQCAPAIVKQCFVVWFSGSALAASHFLHHPAVLIFVPTGARPFFIFFRIFKTWQQAP